MSKAFERSIKTSPVNPFLSNALFHFSRRDKSAVWVDKCAVWNSCLTSLGVTCTCYLVNLQTLNNLKAYKLLKLSALLSRTMFKTFIIKKLQKNLSFAVSKQMCKNICNTCFIKSLFSSSENGSQSFLFVNKHFTNEHLRGSIIWN